MSEFKLFSYWFRPIAYCGTGTEVKNSLYQSVQIDFLAETQWAIRPKLWLLDSFSIKSKNKHNG